MTAGCIVVVIMCSMLAIMKKYMNCGNTGIFKKNSVSSTTHLHENGGTTGVYHSKEGISFPGRH